MNRRVGRIQPWSLSLLSYFSRIRTVYFGRKEALKQTQLLVRVVVFRNVRTARHCSKKRHTEHFTNGWMSNECLWNKCGFVRRSRVPIRGIQRGFGDLVQCELPPSFFWGAWCGPPGPQLRAQRGVQSARVARTIARTTAQEDRTTIVQTASRLRGRLLYLIYLAYVCNRWFTY